LPAAFKIWIWRSFVLSPCALAFAPTATLAQPVLVPESINNLSICAYLFGLAQLEHNMTVPADLSSATARGVLDLSQNIMTRRHHLDAYIQAEYNRQCHNGMFSRFFWALLIFPPEPTFLIGPEQYIQPYVYQGLADANLTDGGAFLCLRTSNLH